MVERHEEGDFPAGWRLDDKDLQALESRQFACRSPGASRTLKRSFLRCNRRPYPFSAPAAASTACNSVLGMSLTCYYVCSYQIHGLCSSRSNVKAC